MEKRPLPNTMQTCMTNNCWGYPVYAGADNCMYCAPCWTKKHFFLRQVEQLSQMGPLTADRGTSSRGTNEGSYEILENGAGTNKH